MIFVYIGVSFASIALGVMLFAIAIDTIRNK